MGQRVYIAGMTDNGSPRRAGGNEERRRESRAARREDRLSSERFIDNSQEICIPLCPRRTGSATVGETAAALLTRRDEA